jgi:hypothetical protein
MEPPGWGKHARKFYLTHVCELGELTRAYRKAGFRASMVEMRVTLAE